MTKKTPSQLDADIDAYLAEAEATAADYVGTAKARALAKSGYFRREYERTQGASAARKKDPDRYDVTTIGGAVLHRGLETFDHAVRVAESAQPAKMVVEVWKLDGATGKRRKVAERIRWNASEKRREWDTFPPL